MSEPKPDAVTEFVESAKLLDTHEHLEAESQRVDSEIDFFHFFSHYASCDLVSAGFPAGRLEFLRDPGEDLAARWELFELFWRRIEHGAYARVIRLALAELYDTHEVTFESVRALTEKLRAENAPGIYRRVLREKANIDIALLDAGRQDDDLDLFATVCRFEEFVALSNRDWVKWVEAHHDGAVHSLADMVSLMGKAFELAVDKGLVAVKFGHAYCRSLKCGRPDASAAERALNAVLSVDKPDPSSSEIRAYEDYMIHEIIRRATDFDLPIQFHTGLQEGNGNVITNSNPTHLTGLFLEYDRAKFVIFHGGYPYVSEAAVLAKTFPNVVVDMCWLHGICPSVARRALDEWLETVPANKIFGFGGDYIFVEGTYGASRLARRNVAAVLSGKVADGEMNEDEAIRTADMILHRNAYDFYGIARWREGRS